VNVFSKLRQLKKWFSTIVEGAKLNLFLFFHRAADFLLFSRAAWSVHGPKIRPTLDPYFFFRN